VTKTDIKQTVIQAAMPLFARFGFRKTSVDELARAARVSKATIYAHFDSKEAIFAEVVRSEGARVFALMDAAVAAARGFDAKLRAFFESFLDAINASELLQQASSEVMAELLPLAQEVDSELEAEGYARLRAIVAAGVEAGELEITGDIDTVARALDLAAFSLHLACLDRDEARVRRDLPALLDLLLRGLRACPAPQGQAPRRT
jgi:AcrR family transcriptional regulator